MIVMLQQQTDGVHITEKTRIGERYPSVPSARPSVRPSASQHGCQQRIEQHLKLVRRMARRIAESTRRIDLLDDLLQAGFFGLVDAAGRFDEQTGQSFLAFARPRIQGAIIDELRSQDWRPRRISQSAAKISRQISVLEQRLGRTATEKDVAEALGISLKEYRYQLDSIECGQLESLVDDSVITEDDCCLEQEEIQQQFASAIEQLPINERQLLGFYYQHGLNQCEIAVVFHLTEARISQLHRQALLRLKAILQKDCPDLDAVNVMDSRSC